jgi:hypothetical protein
MTMLKNYEPELNSRLRRALKPFADRVRQYLAEDEALRHKSGSYHQEHAEDFHEALRGKVVESNGSDEVVAEFIKWGGHDMRNIKGIYGALQDLVEIARERNGKLFAPTAKQAAEAALAAVNEVAAAAQQQWDKISVSTGEPRTVCRFVATRCRELKEIFEGIIAGDDRFGVGTLAEFIEGES